MLSACQNNVSSISSNDATNTQSASSNNETGSNADTDANGTVNSLSDDSSVSLDSASSDTSIDSADEEIITDNITVSAPEVPYFDDNNFTFTSERTYNLPYAVYFSTADFGTIINVPGISLSNNEIACDIYDISAVSADEAGYVDVTITVSTNISFEIIENDSLYDNSFYSYSVHKAEFELADYYTGIKMSNINQLNSNNHFEVDIDINNTINSISVNTVQNWGWEAHNWKITNRDIPIYTLPVSAVVSDIYTIHMPEDYDGLVLYVEKAGLPKFTQEDLDRFKESSKPSDEDDEIKYILDNNKPKDFYCIRVSDYL